MNGDTNPELAKSYDQFRDYGAGELVGRPGVTREDQLALPANWESKGRLFLQRCVACTDSPRGRENYMPAVSSGTCAWCGWPEVA